MQNAIQVEKLSYRFGHNNYLFDELELDVPNGACFGLLGRNGAGKTTLMKLLCGLLTPQQGKIQWWDKDLKLHATSIYQKVGLLIGEPRLYNHLSGTENLEIYTTYRELPVQRITDVLHQVGLDRQATKKVSHYSTGMRQRLGIALALLHHPDFLILDEPTNGLDPQGIAEVRQLILELRQQHTILISSHLLSEVEQTCTHLAVLDEGKRLFQGTLEGLRLRKQNAQAVVVIESAPGAAWPSDLSIPALPFEGGQFRISSLDKMEIPGLIDRLRSRGFPIYQIRLERPNLEASFLDLFQAERK